MTENQRAALAWARRNDKRVADLAKQVRESWRAPEDRARMSESIDALTEESKRFRAYVFARPDGAS